jgi:hypothetical protein
MVRGISAFNSGIATDTSFRVFVGTFAGIAFIVGMNIWLAAGAIPYGAFDLP